VGDLPCPFNLFTEEALYYVGAGPTPTTDPFLVDLSRGPSHSAIPGGWAGHNVDPSVIHTSVIHLVSHASYYELHIIIRHLITH